MIEQKDKLEVLLRERSDLRKGMGLASRGLERSILGFTAVLFTTGAIYSQATVLGNSVARGPALLVLSQVELFLVFFSLYQMAVLNVHVGYMRYLESRINEIAGDRLSLFESIVNPRFVMHVKAAYFWAIMTMVMFGFGFFVWLMISAFDFINNLVFGVILAVELLAAVVITIASIGERDRIYKFVAREKDAV